MGENGAVWVCFEFSDIVPNRRQMLWIYSQKLFYFPSYFLLIICFNQANYITLHLLLPVLYPLRSAFCFRRFCFCILRNFCRSHGGPSVCACMRVCLWTAKIRIILQSHGFASGELAKNETWLCFQVYLLIFTYGSQTSWQWQNVFVLKHEYFENAHTSGDIFSLFSGSL